MINNDAQLAVAIGGGGHAKVVIDAALAAGCPTIRAVLDENSELHGCSLKGVEVLGSDNALPLARKLGVTHFLITVGSIGDSSIRRHLFQRYKTAGLEASTVVHPRSVISPEAKIGEGAVVLANAVINSGVRICENVIINTAAVVEHDTFLEAHVNIAPGAILGGEVHVGQGAHIGMGATVLQGVAVGDGAVIGAGAVVIDDIANGVTVVGNPARAVR